MPVLRRYLAETRTPTFAALGLVPLLLAYAVGVLYLGDEARSALDVYSATLTMRLGPAPYLGVVAATAVGILAAVAWRLRRDTWRHAALLGPVALEATVYGVTMGGAILHLMERQHLLGPELVVAPWLEHAVMAAGAAIHEELLFRALLLPALAWLGQRALAMPRAVAWGVALVVSSLAFSAAHHLAGEPWDHFAFTFRTLAGMVFGAVAMGRGLAAATWTHAAYDLYVLATWGPA